MDSFLLGFTFFIVSVAIWAALYFVGVPWWVLVPW